jgi:glycosyltransferase involved in cell wall biosynthesis
MRLAVVNHHGREPAGSELSLLTYLAELPPHIEPTMFLFEEGPFTDMGRARYKTVVLPMSARMAKTTRGGVGGGVAFDALKQVIRLSRAFREHRIDVVLTNSVKAHFIGLPAAMLQRLPAITFIHDVLEGKARAALRLLVRASGAGGIACSKLAARALGFKNPAIVYSPVDTNHFTIRPNCIVSRRKLGIPVDDLPVVGLVGRIAPWKGQDRFIRIAAETLRTQKAHFAIIGSPIFGCDPAYPDELRALAESLNIAEYVHFVSWQSDLSTAYAALDVSVNCSEKEPFGRTTVEAMAASLPVVCFFNAGACEIYTEGRSGYKIDPYDEHAYAQALCKLIAEPATRAAFGANARKEAQELQASNLATRFVEAVASAQRTSAS